MIIYAAADSKYFIEHGLEFINSCTMNGNRCLVTIFLNFEEDPNKQIENVRKFLDENKENVHPNALTLSFMPEIFTDMYDCHIVEPRAYYASFRFLHLPTIMKTFPTEDFLVLDIDSLILTKLPEIKEDIGMYLRLDNQTGSNPYEIVGMKVAAGIFYVSHNQLEIAEDVKRGLLKNPLNWFVDQHALYRTYNELILSKDLSLLDFKGTKWLDWDFVGDSFIWTAKGESRKKDPIYLDMKNKMKKEIHGFN